MLGGLDSCKALKRFLGFVHFYRRFIRNYGQNVALLTALTTTNVPFKWNQEARVVFDNLKSHFISAAVMSVLDPELKFVFKVDAVVSAPSYLSDPSTMGRCARVLSSCIS